VIDNWVMVDINLTSGTEVLIPMNLAEREVIDRWNVVYRFDYSATGGRTITSVIEVTYGIAQGTDASSYGAFDSRSSSSLTAARDIIRASAGSTPVSTAYVKIIGVNTILINDQNLIAPYGMLRCRVTNEPNLANLKPAYYRNFGELVVLAVKAHIYNTLVIKIDESQIRAGASIGRFREIVDGYGDAMQMYNEYVDTKWEKIGIMNDPEKLRKVMKLSLGSRGRF